MSSKTELKLIWGLKVSEDEIRDIPNPKMEVMEHYCRRTFQGTCVGLTAFALGAAIYKQPSLCRNNLRTAAGTIRKHGLKALIGGYLAGIPVFYARSWQKGYSEGDLYNIAYSMRKNNHLLRLDRAEFTGFMLGLVTSWRLGYGILSGAISGVGVAVTGTALLNATVLSK